MPKKQYEMHRIYWYNWICVFCYCVIWNGFIFERICGFASGNVGYQSDRCLTKHANYIYIDKRIIQPRKYYKTKLYQKKLRYSLNVCVSVCHVLYNIDYAVTIKIFQKFNRCQQKKKHWVRQVFFVDSLFWTIFNIQLNIVNKCTFILIHITHIRNTVSL